MNHKRGRPKKSRAGCLLCKPHKANGVKAERASVARILQDKVSDLETSYGPYGDDPCGDCMATQNGLDCPCGYRGCACVIVGDRFLICKYCADRRTWPNQPLRFSMFEKKRAA